ncbi:hypothetical protein TWF730_010485 [Orbilia blumenaviensis]|uniref:Uncharacterized protein n=1 Tax=Orbilia blumenaviensis TaxID=1796055 RepID=A0AAV9UPX7_9PEZI
MPHLPSFFNNKQNRSATALPAGNNISSTSLPSPHQPPLQQPIINPNPHPQSLQSPHPLHHPPPQQQQQHEYTAYSPPPESLSVQQQIALAQAVAAQQAAHQQLNPQSQSQSQSGGRVGGGGPARHSSISGAPSAGPHYSGHQEPVPPPYVPAGLIRQSSGAAETHLQQQQQQQQQQQLLRNDNNTADSRSSLSYSSSSATTAATTNTNTTSSAAYDPRRNPQQQQQQGNSDAPPPSAPAKSTLRKPLLSKDPSSSTSSGGVISGLFHRHSSKHSQQQQQQDQNPQDQAPSSSIGRRLSTRKSAASPSPQNSPKIPHQIEEDGHYRDPNNPRSPRPQSLLPPPPTVEHVEALRSLRRSDTDGQSYQPRPTSQIQAPSPLTPGPPQYYNVKTGQYEPTHQQQQQQQQPSTPQLQSPPPQSQPQSQSQRTGPTPPPQQAAQPPPQQQQQQQGQQQQQQPQQQKPQHQPPPQQQYPGHKSLPSQSHIQQGPAGFARSSSDLSNLKVSTNHPGGGLAAPSQQQGNNNNNNPPVSPGASVHTVDTMPGNQPTTAGQQSAMGNDGRATPTGKPEGNGGGSGMTPSQVQALMTEFDTLQGKYRKVKNLYFERQAEIERLQNTVANQRMSQSRTHLDDNQYTSRFERLDGAIKNLAFEIRQSWKVIPGWLQPVVNPGAEVKGGREMTVVGRAAMSRWVVDEILDRYFHPGLEPVVSWNLKAIENGIRRNGPQPQSIEEDDNLSAKVCSWRMSTVDGVRPLIDGPLGKENVEKLKISLEEKLMASLAMHLNEPLPAGLPGGVNTIIDISVGLLENLPLESRDVRVWYPLPGEKFDTVFMRGETGLQPLVAPIGAGAEGADKNATLMVDGKPISQVEKSAGGQQPPPPPPSKDEVGLQPSNSVKSAEAGKKQSVLKGIRGKLSGAAGGGSSGAANNQQASAAAPATPQGSQPNPSQTSLAEPVANNNKEGGVNSPVPQTAPGLEKVRVAGFMAVEVRGKSILIKAPVWT